MAFSYKGFGSGKIGQSTKAESQSVTLASDQGSLTTADTIADTALGAPADAAVTNPASSGSVIALLKGWLTGGGAVADAAVTDPTASGSIIALLKGLLSGGLRKTKALTSAYINTTGTGDISIVSGTASQTIRVHRIWFTNGAAATTLLIKDAAGGTTLAGVDLQPGGTFGLDFSSEPHFVTATAGAFVINSSVSSQLRGMVEYVKSA